jgi:hypothetical protein
LIGPENYCNNYWSKFFSESEVTVKPKIPTAAKSESRQDTDHNEAIHEWKRTSVSLSACTTGSISGLTSTNDIARVSFQFDITRVKLRAKLRAIKLLHFVSSLFLSRKFFFLCSFHVVPLPHMALRRNLFWYAVAKGRRPGVYNSFDDAQQQVEGFANPSIKRFGNRVLAEKWLRRQQRVRTPPTLDGYPQDSPSFSDDSDTDDIAPGDGGGSAEALAFDLLASSSESSESYTVVNGISFIHSF